MSIIPIARLSASDIALLGNNVAGSSRRSAPSRRRTYPGELAAINRSLSTVGEQVSRLPRPASPVREKA